MRKIKKDYLCIGLAVIMGLSVVFGGYKYNKVMIERENELFNIITEARSELTEFEDEYGEFGDKTYWSYDDQKEFSELSEELMELNSELKEVEVKKFKNSDKYEEILNKMIMCTEEFSESIDCYLKYIATDNYVDDREHGEHLDNYADLRDEVDEFIGVKKMKLNEF